VRGDAGQVDAAGAVPDDDRGVDAPQEHGVHVDEVDREDAAGLCGQELLPRRARAAGRWADTGIMQDLPYRRGRDRMAEPDQFALHPPVPPGWIVRRHLDHELPDRGYRRRPSGMPAACIVPFARDNRRCHASSVAGVTMNTSCRRRRGTIATKPRATAGRPVRTDSADLAAQDHVLVPEHQELGIFGHLVPGQTTYEQVDNRNDHAAMIPAGKSVQARSSNRAPQDPERGRHAVQRQPSTSVKDQG